MTTTDVYAVGECAQHRGEVYGLVAPLWDQAKVLADHSPAPNPKAAYHGSRIATKLKVAGVDVASMGLKTPERDDDEFVQFSEPRRGVYKSVIIRDGRLVGATLLGDVSKVAVPDAGVRPRAAAAGGTHRSCCSTSARRRPRSAPPSCADDAQVCNCNGVSKGDARRLRAAAARRRVTGVMDATRAGKGCGSCKALVAQIVEWAAGGRGRGGPVRRLVRARACRCPSPS